MHASYYDFGREFVGFSQYVMLKRNRLTCASRHGRELNVCLYSYVVHVRQPAYYTSQKLYTVHTLFVFVDLCGNLARVSALWSRVRVDGSVSTILHRQTRLKATGDSSLSVVLSDMQCTSARAPVPKFCAFAIRPRFISPDVVQV